MRINAKNGRHDERSVLLLPACVQSARESDRGPARRGGERFANRLPVVAVAWLGLAASWLPLTSPASDDGVLPSTSPPGQLAPSVTPQIVLLTFDDSVTTASYALVQQALTNQFNPNGHPIKATFFVSLDSSYDFVAIRRLYDAGHEIAVHTMTHATDETCSVGRWQQEIAGEKRTLCNLSGIPPEDIVGFRAPFLRPNDQAFRVLSKRKFLYDSSFPERLAGFSTSPTNMLWPYTLDQGLMQEAEDKYRPHEDYPGLFEIPLWDHFTNATPVATMDPPEAWSYNEVVALWKTNFLSHYTGNRAPYGLFLHATTQGQWLSNPAHSAWRVAALREFIAWALAQPDTWFITCHDLVAFMRDPVAASAAAASPPFLTPQRTPFPTSGISRCSYPGRSTFSVCGACPPAAPTYTNAYLGLVPMGGGTAVLNVVSQSSAYAWCELVVSNDTSQTIYDWAVTFTVTGGAVQQLYDATWKQTGEQVYAVARQYNRQILAGAALVLTFRVSRSSGEVTFRDKTASVSGLGQLPIVLSIRPLPESAGWRLTWDDNAYEYRVERATDLRSPQAWTTVSDDLCLPEFTEPGAADGRSRFYRVKGGLEDP